MNVDVANQMERLVKLLEMHPAAFIGTLVALLLILGFQKDGLFSRFLAYLEAKATREAGLEGRRMEIIYMLESRSQMTLPGIDQKEDVQP